MDLTPKPVLPPLDPSTRAELRESIRQHGVLVPILITNEGDIIDGHERHAIALDLKIKKYPIRIIGNLTEPERKEMAIRLNVERRHLTAQQRRQLLDQIVRETPQKSTREIADLLKIGNGTVSRAKVKAGVPIGTPVVGRDGKTYGHKPACSTESPSATKEAALHLTTLGDDAPSGGQTIRTLRQQAFQKKAEALADSPKAKLPTEIKLFHCDFLSLERKTGDLTGKVDLVISDPPWISDHVAIYEDFAKFAARVLKPGGICVFHIGQQALPFAMKAFDGVLDYQWLITCLNDRKLAAAKLHGQIQTRFRLALLFSKGRMQNNHQITDVLDCDDSEKFRHPLNWQQPVSECVQLVECLSRPGALILDPMMGTSTTGEAVMRVGQGRMYIGCDQDIRCVRIARQHVANREKARA